MAVSKVLFVYLEDKHLPPQQGHCIKVSITDVGGLVVWQLGRLRRSRRPRRRWREIFFWSDGLWFGLGFGGGGGGEDGRGSRAGACVRLGGRIQVTVSWVLWGINWRISGLVFRDRRKGGGGKRGIVV